MMLEKRSESAEGGGEEGRRGGWGGGYVTGADVGQLMPSADRVETVTVQI